MKEVESTQDQTVSFKLFLLFKQITYQKHAYSINDDSRSKFPNHILNENLDCNFEISSTAIIPTKKEGHRISLKKSETQTFQIPF